MDLLFAYKEKIMGLAKTKPEADFLDGMISQWYIRSRKIGIFPDSDIVCISDLEYANKHRKTRFPIGDRHEFKKKTGLFYSETFGNLEEIDTSKTPEPDYKAIGKLQKNMLLEKYNNSGLLKKPVLFSNKKFKTYAGLVIGIYKFIGMNNIHLGIPKIANDKSIELFGSPLNTFSDRYCSLFEFEKPFGSLGNFFEYKLEPNQLYLCNPPFEEETMNQMADRLISQLETGVDCTIFVTMPVWDSESQKKIGAKDYGMKFEAFEKLIKCKYLVKHKILDRNYKYYNFYLDKHIPVCYSHAILLAADSDKSAVFDNLIKNWEKITK